jgi:Tfp pilus assembly protein PilV
MQKRKLPNSRGFTLIEVLIATVVLVAAAIGLIGFTITDVNALKRIEKSNQLLSLARRKLEEVGRQEFEAITNESNCVFTDYDGKEIADCRGEVKVTSITIGAEQIKRVVVNASSQQGNQPMWEIATATIIK